MKRIQIIVTFLSQEANLNIYGLKWEIMEYGELEKSSF